MRLLQQTLTLLRLDLNPAISDLPEKLGRQRCSLDPALRIRGIRGLEGASNLDRSVWQEFHANLEEAVPATEEALHRLFGAGDSSQIEVLQTRRQAAQARSDWSHGDHGNGEVPPRPGIFPRGRAEKLRRPVRCRGSRYPRVVDWFAHSSLAQSPG